MYLPAPVPWLSYPNNIRTTTKEIINLNMQFSPTSFTLSLFYPDIFVSTLFSSTFSPRTSLTRRTHPYKTTTKFTTLRTSVLAFLGNTYKTFSSRRPGSNPLQVQVGFVVDILATKQVFLPVFRIHLVIIVPQIL